MSLVVSHLAPDWSMRVIPTAERPAEICAQAACLWQEALELQPSLFDGRVLSLVNAGSQAATGEWVPYSWFLAQRRQPDLFAGLGVRAVGVSGILRCPDGLVFGRRSVAMSTGGNQWELVPSGGVDPSAERAGSIDFTAMIRTELLEEVGVRADSVRVGVPFAWIEDPSEHIIDIGMRLDTELSAATLDEVFVPMKGREYDELRVVPSEQIRDFAETCHGNLLPVSCALLTLAGFQLP